jgi:hypothetical protein
MKIRRYLPLPNVKNQLAEGWWWRPGEEPPLEYVDTEVDKQEAERLGFTFKKDKLEC